MAKGRITHKVSGVLIFVSDALSPVMGIPLSILFRSYRPIRRA